ncbi:MAG: acetylornithine transaminase [Evtepia gabavorous]
MGIVTFAELKALDETYVMHTYGRFPVDIDHGQGATLYSLSGRKYIDFTSGIGVNSLGYGNPKWMAAITEQIGKLGHISNLFYTQPGTLLAQQLCTRSGMDKVFFGNSGAEANEAMIKVARKYSFDKYGKGRSTILTLNRSFHGRTITTLTATGQESYHNYFFPFNEAFRYADPTLESIQAQAGDDVCAVMVELIQGEGGLRPLEVSMVQSLAALCREKDWLLLVDEVQTGIGRTGSLFAFQQFGIQPDVVSFAKGIAGGLPLGGILTNEKCAGVLTPGTHGSTFGANPVSTAAGLAVLETMDQPFLDQVREKGAYLRAGIQAIGSPELGDVVGLGLMLGIDVRAPDQRNWRPAHRPRPAVPHRRDRLCLLPPLVTKEEMDEGLAILKQTSWDKRKRRTHP